MLESIPANSSYTRMDSPVGMLWLFASAVGLHAIRWQENENSAEFQNALSRFTEDPAHPHLRNAVRQLEQYFKGLRREFELKLAPTGTEFQEVAWEELRRIPYGKTISYSDQASKMGDVKWTRAVGTANGHNPLPIVIPCHRVINMDGGMGGFSGGLAAKKYLLALEGGFTQLELPL